MSRVACIIAADFEDSELSVPVDRLEDQGHEVVLVGLSKGDTLRGKKGDTKVTTEAAVADVRATDFDALLIPGGYSPDKLRIDERAVRFVRDFDEAGKPIAAICHGPQLLIEAGVVDGRRMTSWPSVKTDLQNAGANWEDASVVVDGELVTSRKPADLDDFSDAFLAKLRVVDERTAANA